MNENDTLGILYLIAGLFWLWTLMLTVKAYRNKREMLEIYAELERFRKERGFTMQPASIDTPGQPKIEIVKMILFGLLVLGCFAVGTAYIVA